MTTKLNSFSIRPFLKQIGKSFADLIYPPLCLHCQNPLEADLKIFCNACLLLFSPIDPKERCPYCFTSEFNPLKEKCCSQCRVKPPILDKMAAVFDYEGPAATLIKYMKYGGQPYLATAAGAYLAAQLLTLQWPMPDCIVPMPMAPLRRLERGYNQSELLAETLAGLLNIPCNKILGRRSGDFSQAGLNHQQRQNLSQEAFYLKKTNKLYDQKVLIVDDVVTTGSSLNCCAATLKGLYPAEVHALTVCRAI